MTVDGGIEEVGGMATSRLWVFDEDGGRGGGMS